MRTLLLSLLLSGAMASHAQTANTTPVTVPTKAVAQLEKMLRQTQTEVVIGKKASALPAETRPMLNKVLVQSAHDFLTITTRQPTKEAYLQSLDAGLASLNALVAAVEDRQQVAEYYQDLLDIVGLESSEGRLMAFVEQRQPAK